MDNMEIAMVIFGVVLAAIAILIIVSLWKLFEKAGEPGWACIIPIYNFIVLLRIVGKPWWWLLISCIPYVGIIWQVWSTNMLSKSFGKDEGFTAGLVFLPFIFIPILAFGDTQYMGPYGDKVRYEAFQRRNRQGFDFENNILES